jgi:hypothetical protein
MRVLFRITLTVLIAVPMLLVLALFFALQGVRGVTPASEGEETLSCERAGPGTSERPRGGAEIGNLAR